MASQKQEIASALEQVKANKAIIARNKVASNQLLASSSKFSKAIESLFTSSKSKVDDSVEGLKKTVSDLSTDAKSSIASDKSVVEEIRKEAKKEYDKFKRTYYAASDEENGVAARHKNIAALHDDAKKQNMAINKDAASAQQNLDEIKKSQKSAKQNEEGINAVHDRAQKLQQEIEDTYSITLDTTLAGTLVTRRDDLKPRARAWEWMYLGSIVAIAGAIIAAFTINPPQTVIDVATERLVFITPLVVIAFVANRQFAHERRLLEEYAFKAATAQSLKGYTLLLNEQFKDMPESRKDILAFTISAMKGIYDRQPLEGRSGKYHFILGSKLAKIEAKIEEIQQEVKKEKEDK